MIDFSKIEAKRGVRADDGRPKRHRKLKGLFLPFFERLCHERQARVVLHDEPPSPARYIKYNSIKKRKSAVRRPRPFPPGFIYRRRRASCLGS